VTEHLPAIQDALVERHGLRLRYYSFQHDEETRREVDPYHLTYFNGGLYLVGYCHLRRAIRVFAVERIRGVDVLSRRFTLPATFDPEAYLNGALGIISGDLVTVRVVFAKKLARYIRERLWHPSQKFRDLSDGRLELTLHVADTLEVRRWILGYGVQAEVIEPAAMREALRQEAEALAVRLAPRRKPLATATESASKTQGRFTGGA
jgi:proteasome accessory factor B